jgi:hypothetical protein
LGLGLPRSHPPGSTGRSSRAQKCLCRNAPEPGGEETIAGPATRLLHILASPLPTAAEPLNSLKLSTPRDKKADALDHSGGRSGRPGMVKFPPRRGRPTPRPARGSTQRTAKACAARTTPSRPIRHERAARPRDCSSGSTECFRLPRAAIIGSKFHLPCGCPESDAISATGLLDLQARSYPVVPFFHQEQAADTIQKPAGVDGVGRIALPGRQLTVRNVVAKRRATQNRGRRKGFRKKMGWVSV